MSTLLPVDDNKKDYDPHSENTKICILYKHVTNYLFLDYIAHSLRLLSAISVF